MESALVNEARWLAEEAHATQTDKAGRPYIEHVARVAAAVAGDDAAEMVAWLHDVLEDQPAFGTRVMLFPQDVVEAVFDLTRGVNKSEAFYYWSIRQNPLSLKVKLADIADNSDESRLTLLDAETATRLRAKYAKARAALGVK
ncbi:metal dependent phosphohydrolase [Stenotrophomonas sp. SKA14]|uniref:HD domain-containing protein n=1 Tax=Stenotrophomonas TaxID=40323 RepID=UPI00018FE998|nr:HD domain-containing protein [Stenotrophomonas sp. SKA14]EED39536.1 metal dependent phosphohydrolase [Stenotrophomonas sp. SKA14]